MILLLLFVHLHLYIQCACQILFHKQWYLVKLESKLYKQYSRLEQYLIDFMLHPIYLCCTSYKGNHEHKQNKLVQFMYVATYVFRFGFDKLNNSMRTPLKIYMT